VIGLFSRIRKLGIKLITIHVAKNAIFGRTSTVDVLKEYGLLGKDILISHGSCLEEHEYKILKDAGIYISSTPDTEAQMGMGAPVCFDEGVNGCLGVDCHVNNSCSILDQARTGLLLKRAQYNGELMGRGKYPKILPGDAEQAFNLATIQGARACGMEEEIGSLEVGKKADVVVFDAEGSTSMLGAAEHDPAVAVVRFSSVRDIEIVIVDGIIRKEHGMLVDVDMKGQKTTWRGIAKELRGSREEVQKRLDKLDVEKGKELLIVSPSTTVRSFSYFWLTETRTCGTSIVTTSSSLATVLQQANVDFAHS
jgi:cytosine/adenosine deaminase-related metal-dependent hydrolase